MRQYLAFLLAAWLLLSGVSYAGFYSGYMDGFPAKVAADPTTPYAQYFATGQEFEATDNTWYNAGTGDLTIAGWIKFDDISGDSSRKILDKYSTTGYQLYGNNYSGVEHLAWQATDGTNNKYIDITVSSGDWFFYVAEYDSTAKVIRIFIDNSTSTASTGTLNALGTNTVMFTFANGTLNGGAIDNTGIWSRLLSSGERTSLYNSGAGRKYSELSGLGLNTGLLGWYTFKEASGDLVDSAGTKHLAPSASRPTRVAGKVLEE